MQVVCNYKCAIKLTESVRVKEEAKAFKAETAVMKKRKLRLTRSYANEIEISHVSVAA